MSPQTPTPLHTIIIKDKPKEVKIQVSNKMIKSLKDCLKRKVTFICHCQIHSLHVYCHAAISISILFEQRMALLIPFDFNSYLCPW